MNYSRQRELILKTVKESKSHPTAQEIYEFVKGKSPNISLGTVYRDLNFLAEAGVIRRIDVGDKQIHFDGDILEHCHFVCLDCGRIHDIERKDFCRDENKNLIAKGFIPLRKDVIIYGQCPLCNKKEKEN
ncbi:MAG: transcriptional repressor [Bacilli bacterium]|nr:transcriptional repressor [Bacilli bacterium]MDD4584411.1 transcriptional repressor [Bacilli bacterium]